VNHDLPGTPVNVLQCEGGHLVGAKPQTQQQQQDRVIATADRPAPIAGAEQQAGIADAYPLPPAG
jgi:hypothetical protein